MVLIESATEEQSDPAEATLSSLELDLICQTFSEWQIADMIKGLVRHMVTDRYLINFNLKLN